MTLHKSSSAFQVVLWGAFGSREVRKIQCWLNRQPCLQPRGGVQNIVQPTRTLDDTHKSRRFSALQLHLLGMNHMHKDFTWGPFWLRKVRESSEFFRKNTYNFWGWNLLCGGCVLSFNEHSRNEKQLPICGQWRYTIRLPEPLRIAILLTNLLGFWCVNWFRLDL